MLVTKREVKQTSKKALSLLLALVMIMTSMSVGFGTIASAAATGVTSDQWNTLEGALNNDTVKNASFSGSENNYTVEDPDGKILAAIEAYYTVFNALADRTPANSNAGNRTINQINASIKSEMTSRGISADKFFTGMLAGANVTATGAQQSSSETTSSTGTPPGANYNVPGSITVTVIKANAITGYATTDELPANVVTSRSFTVKHANDKYDYTNSTRVQSGSCGSSDTTYYTHKYTYFTYVSAEVEGADGATKSTQTIKDTAATLEQYEDYFSMTMDELVYNNDSATLNTVSSAVTKAKQNVVDDFGAGVFTHFFSAYPVATLVNDISVALEVQGVSAKLLKAYEDMEKGYDDIITDKAALTTLATTMKTALDAYDGVSASAKAYITGEGFIRADVEAFRNAVLREIELIELRELLGKINADVAVYKTYSTDDVDEGIVTTAMIAAAISKIAAYQSELNKYQVSDIDNESGVTNFKGTLTNLTNDLNVLANIAGYNDRFSAEYAKFASEIFSVTDANGDIATLLDALKKYDSWYTGLKNLIAEMKSVLGEELAEKLFDDLNDVMTARMDDAYVALNALLEGQIDYAYDLFRAFVDGNNTVITMANVSQYNQMKSSIGKINVDVYNFLKGESAHFKLSQEAINKYNEMQRAFPAYQEFLNSHGFSSYQQTTIADLERADTIKDIARKNEDGIYKTSDEDIEKIIELLDALLQNETVKELLGELINKDEDGNPTGEPFDLAALINGLLEGIYTDDLINTIVQYVYPIVAKEFAKVWAGLPPTITITGVDAGIANLKANVDATLSLYNVETAIAAVGVFLSPTTLAKNLQNQYGKNSGEYAKFTDAISVLSSVTTTTAYDKGANADSEDDDTFTNPWEDPKLFENVYEKDADGNFKLDENGNKIQVFNDDGTPKQVYKINWGVDDAEPENKRAAFVDAACAALSGLEPLLFGILTNKTQANANDSDGDPRGHKIGTGSGSAKVQTGLSWPKEISLSLTIDPITLVLKFGGNDGYDNALAPIFEALGLENIPHGETLTTTRKILEDGLFGMIDQLIEKVAANPVTFILEALPNLCYALEGGLVAPLLNMLKTEINYYADAQYSVNAYLTTVDGKMKEAMKSEEPILINLGEMINLADMGLDIGSFQAIWDMIAGGIELLKGIDAPNAGHIATMGKLVEKTTNRSAKTYNYGTAGKAYHIEANKADVLLYLLQYVLGSGLLDKLELPTEGFVAELMTGLKENTDIILAAVVELLNQKEYDTLREYEWFNGLINGESVVGNSAYEIYLNPGNDWTKDKAEYLYENIDALVASILTLAKVDLDKETEGVQNDLGELLGGLIGGFLGDKTLTSLAALLAKLDLNALLAPKAEDAPETVAEGEEAALDIDVNALVKEFLGLDLAAVAAQYAEIAAAVEADPEYVADFGVDAGTTTFAAALTEMLKPLKGVLDFILAGENLTITVEGKTVELVGYDGYNNAIIPILEALGCTVEVNPENALEATLTALLGKIDDITKSDEPIKAIIDILPGVFYFIASKGLSVSVRNLLQGIYVILDTIRPVYDINLNELINGLLPEDFGVMLNIDDIGLEFIFDLLKKFVPDLDLSGLKDVIYDICYNVGTEYDSVSTLQTEWKKGAYSEAFDQADLLTVVLSFVLEWATIEDNAKALDEMLGTDGLIASIGTVFESVEISYGTPNWYYWFETEEEFNSYVEGNTTLPNTLYALTYPNDWSEEGAAYIAENLAELVDMVIGLLEINGKKYDSLAALLKDLVYGDFNITVKEAEGENEAVVINYLFSDETINVLIGLLNGVLANVDEALLGAGFILDVDLVGLKNYTCEKDITTIEGFFDELAYILNKYAKGLVDLLFFGDDFRIAKKSDKTDTIVINGGLGYEKGLALVLEALGCELPEEATVESVLGCLADRVTDILDNPVNEVIDLLPNLVYFLNANGAGVAVDNILQPAYALLDKLSALGVELDLAELLGFDLKYLSLADILALVKDKTGLDLSAAEEILVNLCFGKIEKAEYTYKMVAERKDTITVILTTALMLVQDDDFAAKLEELMGNDLITAIKTVFESAPVTYKTPDWYALDEDDIDYDNATVGVIKYAIEYPNNWTEESAQYVAALLESDEFDKLVAGLIDSNAELLGDILKSKVNIYNEDTLKAIQKLLGDLIGGLDEDLKDLVNVGLGAADALLGADVNAMLAYDVSGVKDKETFVAALTGMLMKVEGLVDWLLLGEDYKFFVDNNKNDIITINGGHGYAEGLALVLEALGVENLPDVYAMEEIDTKAVVKAVLTATFDRFDAILADPVVEVFNILPNVLYFINANGLTVAVQNLIGAINALLIKLEGFGLKVDIASLVNFSEILGVETELALDNIKMADIVKLVAELTGLNLDAVADVLVGFALGRVAAYDSVSSADITAKMYYHDDFAKYDMVTVLATVAIITLTDDANADKVKEMLGENIYQLICNLINMAEVPVQDFDWKFEDRADTDYVFSALSTSDLYAGHEYGPLFTEDKAQYIADNFGDFVDNVIYLLGINIDGKNVDTLKDLINGLLGGSVYNSDIIVTIRDALAGVLESVTKLEVNGTVVGGIIAEVLKTTGIADINAVASVKVPKFDNDRDQFVASLCDVLEPLYGVLKYLLADEDFTFFVNAEKSDAITLKGAEGYAYGIIPLLEVLDCKNILAPADYYAAVEADSDVLLTSILNPLLDRVDEILADDPAQAILDMLPNLIYFINSNGVDTVVKNTLNAVYTLLAAIEPVAKIDLYEVIGFDLATIDFEWLFEKLLEIIADKTGYEFSALDANAIIELTTGKLESYTSLNGKKAYKMVYASADEVTGGKAEMVTVVMRLLVTFIMHENNQNLLLGLMRDNLGMTADAEKYVAGVLKVIADCSVETRLGMDSALATIYYLFYGADIGADHGASGIKDLNKTWTELLKDMRESSDEGESLAGDIIAGILDLDIFDDIIDPDEGIAPNGLIAFFQKIIEFFKKIFSFFSFGK